MAQRRRQHDDRGAGVILRDRGGAVYAIPSAVLARYRVPDDLAVAVTALVDGEETAAFEQGSGSPARSGETSAASRDRQRVQRILADFQQSRSAHLSNTSATWLLR
jgi:hypothetical protein